MKIQVLEFSKWKFENQYFRLVETLAWLIENDKEKNLGISKCLDRYSIPIWPIENRETGFSAEFSGDYLERLKKF